MARQALHISVSWHAIQQNAIITILLHTKSQPIIIITRLGIGTKYFFGTNTRNVLLYKCISRFSFYFFFNVLKKKSLKSFLLGWGGGGQRIYEVYRL